MSAAFSASGAEAVRGALLVEQAQGRLAHDGDVVGRRHDVRPGAVVGARGGRRAQRERGERCDGGESAARHAPSIGPDGRPAPLNGPFVDVWRSFSAASGRRCGPSARRRARGPSPPCAAVSARIGSGSGTASRAPASQSSTIAGVDLGMELQPDAAPDGEGLQARARLRASSVAPGGSVEDVLVPGEPAPAEAVVAVDVDPADLGLGAPGSRSPPRAAASAWPPKQMPEHRARRPSCASRRKRDLRRRSTGPFEACTERSEPSAIDGARVARVGPRGRPRARAARRRPRRGPRPSPRPARAGASGCCWTTSRRDGTTPSRGRRRA